ncbi:4'-phosphopantetheinyl transferase family protein [Sphaerisporangium sp. NPDC049003]|uniref:4'-phosphopantetheinyl transferase family protein n=1 Tax=Sphaerisporangium sp. NPDC049003 TaxID=3364517 RepID=UPI00371180C6
MTTTGPRVQGLTLDRDAEKPTATGPWVSRIHLDRDAEKTTGPRIFRVHLDQPDDSRWWRMLSDAERERASQLASPTDKHRFTIAHAALRAILGRLCGVRASRLTILTEAGGRPYLALPDGRPPLDFNLSHSGEWALVAVTPGSRVGVDIELIRPDLDCLEMAKRMYQPAEVDRLHHTDPAARHTEYFALWSAKEAYVKAIGIGLAGLRDVLVNREADAPHGTVLSRTHPGALWPVRWLDAAPGYSAALVTGPDRRQPPRSCGI